MKKIFFIAVVMTQIFLMNFASAEIIDKPLPWSENRERLTREYAEMHYGFSQTEINPQAVVVHWTAGSTWESAYNIFYDDTLEEDGWVNVSSQFIVDRDGTIYRLMPENKLARHAIGYNWCAIGIENVGGVNGVEDLTEAQLQSNIWLIKYLREKFPEIKFVFGHYQQVEARASGLYIEKVPDYFAGKPDPGKIFMQALKDALEGDGFQFFPI